ncbi:MAG: cation-translocating P-type ATPase, partial [Saprospiraceae bacterium]|nr:cation-translocating P-type ATPase [Saprospiraceae bacterium]
TAIHSCYEAYATQNIRNKIQMIHEYPLAGQPPMMTHIYEDQHKKVYIAAKGSWEKIVQICQLPPEELALIKSAVAKMAARGLRILGTAHGENPVKDGYPKNQENFSWHFSGLIGLSDPPKKNISKVFDKFYEAGIQIKMITGDYPETAMAIAKQSGLKNNGQIAIGDEVMKMSGKELEALVRATNIFARMYPQAKLKVINTLRNLGEVVAMTGDGVNDGPALKAAEIGIAMGHRGTEIARNAADLILIDDDLGHMVDAIESGRKIYCNLKKAFRYIISIHIPIIMIVTVPLALGWKYPHIFSPIHVIFLELIMGPTCSIVYENEPVESHLMHTKPRALSESLFSWSELSVSILQGLVITICTLGLYQWATIAGESEDVVRTLTFSTLIFANIFLTLVNRSFEKSIFKTLQYKNALIPIIFVITLLIWAGSIHIEPIKALFQFEHINMVQIIYCIVAGALSVLWIEVIKWWRQKLETRELSAS